jgi:hypothetical protein
VAVHSGGRGPGHSGRGTIRTSWSPTQLASALVSWWDASDASTITLNGSGVSSWANKVAGAPAAAQGTAANQPTYSATGRNGRPALTFDGTNDVLTFTPTGFPSGSGQAVTVVAVGWINGSTASITMFSYGAASNDQAMQVSQLTTGTVVRAGTFGRDSTTAAVWSNLDRIVVASVPSGAGATTVRIDGASTVSSSTSGTANLSATNGRIGANVSGSSFWNGAVQEILVFNRALTATERQQLEGYLAWRWGLRDNIPSDHPYKSAPPGGFDYSALLSQYGTFFGSETRTEYNPNDYAGATQTDRIKAALAAITSAGTSSRLRLGIDSVTSPRTTTWTVTEAVVLPSNTTLLLDGAKLKRADNIFDNVVRNAGIVPNGAAPNDTVSALNANVGIRVLGLYGAIIEGSTTPYSAPHPVNGGASIPWVGDDFGWRTCNMVFCNVDGLEIGGFTSNKPCAWAITLAHGVQNFWVHDINFTSTVQNGDGVDVRNGCRHGRVERITGNTSDDIVAVCAAVPFADGSPYPMLPGGYGTNVLGDDTYDIVIDSISGLGGAGNVVRAFTTGALGTSIHDITITNIHQTGTNTRCVTIGTFGSYTPAVGSLNNFTIQNVTSDTADNAVYVNAPLQNCTFDTLWNKNAAGAA